MHQMNKRSTVMLTRESSYPVIANEKSFRRETTIPHKNERYALCGVSISQLCENSALEFESR